MVPLEVLYPLRSFLNAWITDAVGKKLQWFENAANQTSGPYVVEGGDPIADGLGGLGRYGGPNRRPHSLQGAVRGFRDECQVIVDGLKS